MLAEPKRPAVVSGRSFQRVPCRLEAAMFSRFAIASRGRSITASGLGISLKN